MTASLGKIIADFNTTLNLKVAVAATSATLDSATDDDGVALPTGTYFLTIDGDSIASKEYIKCTLTSTALTSIQSVSRQGALTSGFARTHRKGATVTITDFAIIKKMLDLLDGTTDLNASVPLKYDGTATISNSNHLATKAYADGLAIAGSPDSSTTVKGIGKVSVAPVSPTEPIFVGDNDNRVSPVSLASVTADMVAALAGTSGTPSTSNKYVTNDDTATAATADKVARRLAGGNITVVTESQANNSTNAASTAYVDAAITLINAGVITDLSTLTNGNNDTTVTLTFQPRLIELNYWLQGHDAATSLNIYLGSGGTAVYEGTTLKYNNTLVNNSRLSGENGGLDTTFSNASPNLFKNTNLTTAPFAGTDGGNSAEKKVTLSVNSVSSTGFVIRLVTAGGDGATSRARAAISWKAFK